MEVGARGTVLAMRTRMGEGSTSATAVSKIGSPGPRQYCCEDGLECPAHRASWDEVGGHCQTPTIASGADWRERPQRMEMGTKIAIVYPYMHSKSASFSEAGNAYRSPEEQWRSVDADAETSH